MKRLTIILLFLTCHVLPVQHREAVQQGAEYTGEARFYAGSLSTASSVTHPVIEGFQQADPWKELFKRRPVGLNDGDVEGVAIYSCHIRPLFIYIHTCYRSYAQSFRNVNINLRDWRGPPEIV